VGDALTLQVVGGGTPRAVPVRVGQVFSTGFEELDERFVITDLAALRRRVPGLAGGALEIWLADPDRANAMRERIEQACGRGALVATWQERNRNLFAALRWQKISLAVVLSLVLGVGAFEVASALVVLVTEKRREFGVLLALGGEPRLLRGTLLVAGGTLGAAGVVAGMLLGAGIVLLLDFLGVPHFPPDIAKIYMVETIPLRLLPGDLAAVLGLSLVEVVIAALLPARRASRREPVEVLRWV
jgi:lipoprotein-releasing system permease protein